MDHISKLSFICEISKCEDGYVLNPELPQISAHKILDFSMTLPDCILKLPDLNCVNTQPACNPYFDSQNKFRPVCKLINQYEFYLKWTPHVPSSQPIPHIRVIFESKFSRTFTNSNTITSFHNNRNCQGHVYVKSCSEKYKQQVSHEMKFKMPPAVGFKWQPFCICLNVLINYNPLVLCISLQSTMKYHTNRIPESFNTVCT